MSFLVAINGQFSPYVFAEKAPIQNNIRPIHHLDQVAPKPEFQEILEEAGHQVMKKKPRMEAYQKLVRDYEVQKKRNYARDIMSSPAHMIPGTLSVAEARATLKKFAYRQLPVIDEHGVITGIITDRDLHENLEHKTCAEIMKGKVIVAEEHVSVHDLAIIFLTEKLNAVPIVNRDHKVTGIVTLSDILKYVILNTEFIARS